MKTLRLKNFNNKFACDYFGLIAPAPPEPISNEDIIEPFIIEDIEGNYPDFKAKRITMTRFFLHEIPEIFAYTACGTSPDILINQLLTEYNCGKDQQFAYYLFKKNEN